MDLMEIATALWGRNGALVLTGIISACSILATMLPPSAGVLYRVINVIACNAGHAANATDPNTINPKVNP